LQSVVPPFQVSPSACGANLPWLWGSEITGLTGLSFMNTCQLPGLPVSSSTVSRFFALGSSAATTVW
jgi:hypothetical protein